MFWYAAAMAREYSVYLQSGAPEAILSGFHAWIPELWAMKQAPARVYQDGLAREQAGPLLAPGTPHLCGRVPKTAAATSGRCQLTSDGYSAYPAAVEEHLGGRVDYGQLIKSYSSETVDSERRYSPAKIIATEKIAVSGDPDPAKVCTSHVERTNLHVRMQMRRFTRLTNAFSRKRENLRAALALHFAAYNFTWMHRSIRMTPAMKAGIARASWTVQDLLVA